MFPHTHSSHLDLFLFLTMTTNEKDNLTNTLEAQYSSLFTLIYIPYYTNNNTFSLLNQVRLALPPGGGRGYYNSTKKNPPHSK